MPQVMSSGPVPPALCPLTMPMATAFPAPPRTGIDQLLDFEPGSEAEGRRLRPPRLLLTSLPKRARRALAQPAA